jgi:hypothetical protein
MLHRFIIVGKRKNENELISFFSSSIDLFSSSSSSFFFHIKLRTTKKANKQEKKTQGVNYSYEYPIYFKSKCEMTFSNFLIKKIFFSQTSVRIVNY